MKKLFYTLFTIVALLTSSALADTDQQKLDQIRQAYRDDTALIVKTVDMYNGFDVALVNFDNAVRNKVPALKTYREPALTFSKDNPVAFKKDMAKEISDLQKTAADVTAQIYNKSPLTYEIVVRVEKIVSTMSEGPDKVREIRNVKTLRAQADRYARITTKEWAARIANSMKKFGL